MSFSSFIYYLLLLAITAQAQLSGVTGFAPLPAVCPSTPLVRQANGLSSSEKAWLAKRKALTEPALKDWLSQFGSFPANSLPSIGSAVAGGFLRASMLGAGIHQELSKVEGKGPMAGLLTAVQYETTLSGSVAYLGGLMQNNWPTIESLQENLWVPTYATGMKPSDENTAAIVAQVGTKSAAGYPLTLIDVYGRIIGYSNLYNNGGAATHMSDTRNQQDFILANKPFPIFTSIQTVNDITCYINGSASQYELTPFEFGSWDEGVAAFMDMKYLGTRMNNGKPVVPLCTVGFDNLSFLQGMSANVLAGKCLNVAGTPGLGPALENSPFNQAIGDVVGALTWPINRQVYADVPNPFFGLSSSPKVSTLTDLPMIDGGNSGQVIPLWPLLRREMDVVLVWDNYYDDNGVGTLGTQIYNTYVQAQRQGLKNMPVIPTPAVAQAKGLNKRVGAYGCNDPKVSTFIYVPYQAFIPQAQSTYNLTTTPEQTRNYVKNGNLLATNNGDPQWPKCVACLIMKKKATSLPSYCQACFTKLCYN